MRRFYQGVFLLIIGFILWTLPVSAATPLPESPWYAVAWVEASDTLHWINSNGAQVSIARPKIDGEASQAATRLYISPNGQYMAVVSPLTNGREALGFYDFAAGQFTQIHQTQENEVFIAPGRQPFTEFSQQFAISLRDQSTGEWRIIAFESATGNAIAQLTRTDAMVPQDQVSDTDWYPMVAQFNVDEAINTVEVRFQMVTQQPNMTSAAPSLKWIIPSGDMPQSVVADTLLYNPYAGFDINPMTGEVVYSWFDLQIGSPVVATSSNSISIDSGDTTQPVAAEPSASASHARWLHQRDWVGYRRENNVQMPHWMIVDLADLTSLPLSPNVSDVYHTPDGLLARNSSSWTLDHLTNLDMEGFAEPTGTTIFQPGGAFAVIYTTPAFTQFTLEAVEIPAGDGLFTMDEVQAPITCAGAPPVRLTVGQRARVAFGDGVPLNVRTAPAGEYIMQIPEGTIVEVVDGPECANGYLWWQLQLQSDGVNVGGWSAEGDSTEYYLEPFNLGVVTPLAVQPTDLPVQAAPTSAPPRAMPTATPARAFTATCNQSPETRLAVGDPAHTVQSDGTIGVYPEATAEIPTVQLPTNLSVSIIGGPQCANGIRRWQISTTLNGQSTTGWVAEGFGQNYYLAPGFARAGS